MEQERRAFTAEIRAAGDDKPMLVGHAALFDQRTDIGPFTESIAPGAFADALGDDVRALFNHDPNQILGRTASGTLRIAEDDQGLRFEIDLNEADSDAMKLYTRVQRGDITGNSFSFSVEPDGEEWDKEGERRHRTITKVSRLYDVGPVTFPAYEATRVSARCQQIAETEPVDLTWVDHARMKLDLAEAGEEV